MGRSAVHTSDALVDAALRLFAEAGAEAVTMSALARTTGAPNGSIYYRFPDRPALLAELWLRTTERFQRGYLDVLGEEPTPESAVAAAMWTVEFCRENPADAALLHAGRRTLQPDLWPAEATRSDRDKANARALGRAVRSVAAVTGHPRDEVSFAMLDLPLAVVRRHLAAGDDVPPAAVQRVRRLATRLLLG